jgi:hypothetical protein
MSLTRHPWAIAAFALVPLSVVAACGGGAVQLTQEEYARLPADGQREIFDAENDVVIAQNRQDEAKERERAVNGEVDEIEERGKRAEKRLSATNGGGRIGPARRALAAHVAFLKAENEVAAAAIRATALETGLARERLSLVRQRQLVRIGRAPMASLKDLEQRVAESEKKVQAARALDVDLHMRAQSQLGAWKNAEDEFARGTGDFDTGIWLD